MRTKELQKTSAPRQQNPILQPDLDVSERVANPACERFLEIETRGTASTAT
jgi:hypothetical protein